MDGFASLLMMRGQIVWNTLRTLGQHSRLKILSITVLGGAIWVGLYIFPYQGFEKIVELLREGSIADVMVSLFFFLLTVMLIFSNGVIAYAALFRSKEAAFLNASPCSPATIFLYKMGESLTFSSWAFFLLGVPIMLAYGVHKHAPWYYYLAMPLFFACFVLIPACIGALIALALSALLRPWLRRALIWAGITLGLAAVILGPIYVQAERKQSNVFVATTLMRRMGMSHSVYWPSAWISRGLAICAGSPGAETMGDALYYLGLLASNSLMLCVVAYAFAGRVYKKAWNLAHSTSSRRRYRFLPFELSGRTPDWPMLHLVMKDLRTFVRDPVQWTQCAVLFGLLGLYILNLRNLRYPSAQLLWRNLTTLLNLASICLVLATLTTRFVFPMFSLEGHRFWLLGLMPVNRRKLLWSKLVFSLTASLAVTETLMITSDLMLAEPAGMILLHVYTVAMISIGLSGMAVGLSALYPNLRETSPAKIVSGFGGTLNLILSLLYVAVVVALEAVPVYLWITGQIRYAQMQMGLWIVAGLLLVLAAVTFSVPMWLGSKALDKMEF